MKKAIASLKSAAPYSQSRHYVVPKENDGQETAKDYEARTWRNHIHVGENGTVIIPPMVFKRTLEEAAKFLSLQIPGKGKSTYTKHFEAGVLVTEPVDLGVKPEDVKGEWLFLPSDGIAGSGKRVDKCYPIFHEWKGDVTFHIFDETITPEVFKKVLETAGKFIGIGRFRPKQRGYYGRFEVESVKWQTNGK